MSMPHRFSKHTLPEVNTWVHVALETDPKKQKSKWKNKAVPALVSKVASILGNAQPDVRINVLLPNTLALQYNFQSPSYREVKGLKITDVRPYAGVDQDKLKSLLLDAFRQKARERNVGHMAGNGLWSTVKLNSASVSSTSSAKPSTKRKFVETDMDTTRENISTFFSKYARQMVGNSVQPSPSLPITSNEEHFNACSATTFSELEERPVLSESIAMRSLTQQSPEVGMDGNIGPSEQAPAESTVARMHESAQPQTPMAMSERALVRRVTPIKLENPPCMSSSCAPDVTNAVISPKRLNSKQRLPEIVPHFEMASVSNGRCLQITKLISKAFQAQMREQCGDILSKKAIADALECNGACLREGELDKVLNSLHIANKVFLNDELVFLV